MTNLCLAVATAAAVIVLAVGPAAAGQCGYEYCWGALTIGDRGAAGRATGLRTAPGAADAAQERCGTGCEAPEVFVNACAAFAQDAAGRRTFGWSEDDRASAEAKALSACQQSGKGCRIRIWACSK